jgi:hypothetical protein
MLASRNMFGAQFKFTADLDKTRSSFETLDVFAMNVGKIRVIAYVLGEDSSSRLHIRSLARLTSINQLRARFAETTTSDVCVFVWWACAFLCGLIILPTIIGSANIALSGVGI